MLFRRMRKTRYLSDGFVAAVAETLIPLSDARVIYGDGKDRYDTIFVVESGDKRFQVIGTYDHIIRLSSQIDQRMYEWVYNNSRIDWLSYDKPNREEKGAGNDGQER